MSKLLYKPVSMLVSVLGGLLAGVIFRGPRSKVVRPRRWSSVEGAGGMSCAGR